MNILVLGNGQMGQAVSRIASDRGHVALGPHGREGASEPGVWDAADVVVDFTVGSAVAKHVELALKYRVPLVVGTTGWDAERAAVSARVAKVGGTLVWGANFSIGFHVLAHLTGVAARLMAEFPEFDAGLFEHHHNLKRDAPSGSALTLAHVLTAELPSKQRVETGAPTDRIDPEALHVVSLRAGSEPGLHRVCFDGPLDSVTLEHRVRNRDVFAAGAVYAAEQAVSRTGVIRFRDLVEDSMIKVKGL